MTRHEAMDRNIKTKPFHRHGMEEATDESIVKPSQRKRDESLRYTATPEEVSCSPPPRNEGKAKRLIYDNDAIDHSTGKDSVKHIHGRPEGGMFESISCLHSVHSIVLGNDTHISFVFCCFSFVSKAKRSRLWQILKQKSL